MIESVAKFLVALALFVLIVRNAYCSADSTRRADMQDGANFLPVSTSSSASEYDSNNTSQQPQYTLLSRTALWMKQLLVFAFLTMLALELGDLWMTMSWFSRISHTVYILSVLMLLYSDGIDKREEAHCHPTGSTAGSSTTTTTSITMSSRDNRNRRYILGYAALLFIEAGFVDLNDSNSAPRTVLTFLALVFAVIDSYYNTSTPQLKPPTAEYKCGFISYVTFQYLNAALIGPAFAKEALEIEDSLPLSHDDSAEVVWPNFKCIIAEFKPRSSEHDIASGLFLFKCLLRTMKWDLFVQSLCQVGTTIAMVFAPLVLQRILMFISRGSDSEEDSNFFIFPLTLRVALVLMFVMPLIEAVLFGQTFLRGRHLGVRVRAALIGLIYSKAMTIDLSRSTESVGKINNLVSVDVGEIQTFFAYIQMTWGCVFEMFVITSVLFLVLGSAATGGMIVMCISLLGTYIMGKKLQRVQENLLERKDGRIDIINEVLNNMRIVKYFAWEQKFVAKVNNARKQELAVLKSYMLVKSAMEIVGRTTPALVATCAYLVRTYMMGKSLDPARGFAALTLFNMLRHPMQTTPDNINWFVNSLTSLKRIQSYINTPDVCGLPSSPLPLPLPPHCQSAATNMDIFHDSGRTISAAESTSFSSFSSSSSSSSSHCSSSSSTNIRSISESGGSNASPLHTTIPPRLLLQASSHTLSPTTPPLPLPPPTNPLPQGSISMQNVTLSWPVVTNSHSASSSHNIAGSDHIISTATAGSISSTSSSSSSIPFPQTTKLTTAETAPVPTSVVLRDLTFSVTAGSFTVVAGMTGSGKSSLLCGGILGEAVRTTSCSSSTTSATASAVAATTGDSSSSTVKPEVQVVGTISYVPQSPWIQNATLRDNILFGSEFEEARYQKVLAACSLLADLALLPLGDKTEIGEKGVNLSGGQCQRVSLARAAYAKSDIILLDDPLSALDSKVADHIFHHLICGTDAFLLGRTRVLVTHNLPLALPRADVVMVTDALSRSLLCSCRLSSVPEVLGEKLLMISRRTQLPDVSIVSNATVEKDNISDNGYGPSLSSSFNPNSTDNNPFGTDTIVDFDEDIDDDHDVVDDEDEEEEILDVVSLQTFIKTIINIVENALRASGSNEINGSLPTGPTPPRSMPPVPSRYSRARSSSSATSTSSIDSNISASQRMFRKQQKRLARQQQPYLQYPSSMSSTVSQSVVPVQSATQNEIAQTPRDGKTESINEESIGTIVKKESKRVGDVPFETYWFYLKAAGGALAVVGIIGACFAVSLAWLFQNYSMGHWLETMEKGSSSQQSSTADGDFAAAVTSAVTSTESGMGGNNKVHFGSNVTFAMLQYLGSVVLVLLCTSLQAIIQLLCGLGAAQTLHDLLIVSVMQAECNWFDSTPVGRIINRFGQDISSIDSEIIYRLFELTDFVIGTAQIVLVVSIVLPSLLVPFIPIIAFTGWVVYQYLHVSREMKRLESVHKSPVFVLFSETLQGLSVIRSFRDENRFFRNCCRLVDDMNTCHLSLWLCNRWLNFRMMLMGSMTFGLAGLGIIYSIDSIGTTAAGIVLIYTLTFTENLTFLARSYAEVQINMNSVERIQEYSILSPEKYGDGNDDDGNCCKYTSGSSNSSSSSSAKFTDEPLSFTSESALLSATFDDDDNNNINTENDDRNYDDSGFSEEGGGGGDIELGTVMMKADHNTLHHRGDLATAMGKTERCAVVSTKTAATYTSTSTSSTTSTTRPPAGWPSKNGSLVFKNVSLQYKNTSAPVLKELSFAIPARCKVGVVGRTGAGKSSLVTALFRLVEPLVGSAIILDGVDLLTIPLHKLRTSIAIVPQEPILFQGSLRMNLDPFDQHSDEEIWEALRAVRMSELIEVLGSEAVDTDTTTATTTTAAASTKGRGIANVNSESDRGDYIGACHSTQSPPVDMLSVVAISNKGSNWSVGQRQLLCLARALLRNAPVLVLDECTASVDYETDFLIQETVKKKLANSTVLCIAHRLHTLTYYDKVLVMDGGRVAEFDDPFNLINTPGSVFRAMCESSGDFQELYKAIQIAHEERLRSPSLPVS